MFKGSSPGIMKLNMKALKNSGKSELDATKGAMKVAGIAKPKKKSHPNRHKNLKGFLHPKGKGAVPMAAKGMPIATNVDPEEAGEME